MLDSWESPQLLSSDFGVCPHFSYPIQLIAGLFPQPAAGPVSKERGRPAIVRRSRHVPLHVFVSLVAVFEALGSLVRARAPSLLGHWARRSHGKDPFSTALGIIGLETRGWAISDFPLQLSECKKGRFAEANLPSRASMY